MINFEIALSENHGWTVKFPPEFEELTTQQKLDLLQDAVFDLNQKWAKVNDNY